MRSSTLFVILACAGTVGVVLLIAFLNVAKAEPPIKMRVRPTFLATVRRGDLVSRGDEVYRVQSIHAPHTLIVRRTR